MKITNQKELDDLREGGRILHSVLMRALDAVKPGISTLEIDAIAEAGIREAGGIPAFKGYRQGAMTPPFPGTICASINHEIVHGIPNANRVLEAGDLFKVDIGMKYKGLITDMARTVGVGYISHDSRALIDVTVGSLDAGIATIRSGSTMLEFATAVSSYAQSFGYSVVRDLVGHGVGKRLHEPPQIPNFPDKRLPNFLFTEGMVVALEPMINVGTWKVDIADDGWTFVTADGELSAHHENTLMVTKNATEIITRGE